MEDAEYAVTEDELWGKMASLLTFTGQKNLEKTVVVMLEVMRGSLINPADLAWYVDEKLAPEIKQVCADLAIPYDRSPTVSVVKERGH